MYKETCNEISENLLDDFIDSDDETRIVLPKALSEHKKVKVATSSATEPLDPKIKIVDISTAVQKKFNPNEYRDNDFKKIKD